MISNSDEKSAGKFVKLKVRQSIKPSKLGSEPKVLRVKQFKSS